MKNPYTKFIKYLEKQETIRIQRSGESVYLTDGKAVLMLPIELYDSMIRPLSGVLPVLEGDCTAEKQPYDVFATVRPDGLDIEKVVDGYRTDKIVHQSRFILEHSPAGKSKKSISCRIFKAEGGDIITVNKSYIDMFADCDIGGEWTSSGRQFDPLVKKNDDFALLIMPMKVDRKYFNVFN